MIRTNSKEAKRRIQGFISEHVADYIDCENEWITEAYKGITENSPFSLVADFVLDCFHDEELRNHAAYKAGRVSAQDVFHSWCAGLSGKLPTSEIFLGATAAIDTLGAILDESDEEKARYSENAAERMLTALMFRELTAAATVNWR